MRHPIKAEKARATSEVEVGDDERDDEDDDGAVDGDHEHGGKGEVASQGPREKKKAAYLPYDDSKHFYWVKMVRHHVFLFVSSY